MEIDYSQLESAEDYELVAGHLNSLRGDAAVHPGSLGIAQFNLGIAAARENFVEFTSVDIANGVFEYHFRQSQKEALAVVGIATAAPMAPGLAMRGAALYSGLPRSAKDELIAFVIDLLVEISYPNGALTRRTGVDTGDLRYPKVRR